MELIAASKTAPADLRYMVREVKVAKLYYVTTGRNAWWSTWITRYSPGCMHSTLDSAKSSCEQRRVQGTVFYIDELPSLAFVLPERALLVSEINTEAFLERFDSDRLTSMTTVLPVSTMTLSQMTYVFRPQSPLWPKGYPKKDSAILSFCSKPETHHEIAPNDQMSSWASSSSGPNYYLRWSERPFTRNRSTLHALALALRSRMGEN